MTVEPFPPPGALVSELMARARREPIGSSELVDARDALEHWRAVVRSQVERGERDDLETMDAVFDRYDVAVNAIAVGELERADAELVIAMCLLQPSSIEDVGGGRYIGRVVVEGAQLEVTFRALSVESN